MAEDGLRLPCEAVELDKSAAEVEGALAFERQSAEHSADLEDAFAVCFEVEEEAARASLGSWGLAHFDKFYCR